MKKKIYINLFLRLLFMFLLVYSYTMIMNSTSDLAIILMLCLPYGVLLVFIGFYIIDYFSLKKIDASLRFALLTSFVSSLVCFFMIFSDSSDLKGRILFAIGSTFLPSLFSYFCQRLVSTL